MLAKRQNFAANLINNLALALWFAVFEDVLYNVVTVLIHDHVTDVCVHFIQHHLHLLFCTVLQYTLDDTTAVRVCRQLQYLYAHTTYT